MEHTPPNLSSSTNKKKIKFYFYFFFYEFPLATDFDENFLTIFFLETIHKINR